MIGIPGFACIKTYWLFESRMVGLCHYGKHSAMKGLISD